MKRKGFAATANLTVATSPVSGSYHFVDSIGNDQVVVCHDVYCAHSTNSGAFSNFISSSPNPQRWSFVDINGILYGVNDKFSSPIAYNGVTLTIPMSASAPLGSLIELTKDRLIISGVTANPNRLYLSQSGVYTNFTVGINSPDPWNEDVGTNGDKITALKYAFDRLFIFKRQSIVSCVLGDQYTTYCFPVSNTIGTQSPASVVVAPNALYFQAQNGTYWRLTDSSLDLLTKKQTNLISSQVSASSNQGSDTEQGQSDWQAGTQFPLKSWNTTAAVGSIFASTTVFTDNTTAHFSSGTRINTSTGTNSVFIYQPNNKSSFRNAGAEQANGDGLAPTDNGVNWTTYGGAGHTPCGGIPQGNKFGTGCFAQLYCNGVTSLSTINFSIFDENNNLIQSSSYTIQQNHDVWENAVATLTAINTSKIRLDVMANCPDVSVPGTTPSTATWISPYFVKPDYLSIWYTNGASGAFSVPTFDIDESILTATGTFTSRCFDTTYSTPTWGPFTLAISSSNDNRLYFQTQVATSCSGQFDAIASTNSTGKITSAAKQAIKYIANFDMKYATAAPAIITSVGLNAATTGQFWTQCIQTSGNIASWGAISCSLSNSGAGAEVLYATATASCASLPATPPLFPTKNWTQQTNNTNLSLGTSISTAVTIGFVSLLGSATDQAMVNSCILNWTNNNAQAPVWGVYDHIKNAIYWHTAINNSLTNNRMLKYDLNLDAWYPFDIPGNAPLMVNNTLYFGGASTGTWYSYGSVNADNGGAINAYWKSKDFAGDPFRESIWKQAFFVMRNTSTSGTVTLTNSLGGTDSYNVSLSTVTTLNYVRSSHAIKLMSPAPFMNVKIANSLANGPFELNGLKLNYFTNPINISNP